MASIYFEVECEIEGVMRSPDETVGEWSAGVDDLDLSSVSMLVSERKDGRTIYRNVDMLDGLDVKALDQVIRNILAVYGDDAEEEFLNDQ